MSVPVVSELLDFDGKVVLVTGAGSGLGQRIARRFGEAGAKVVVHYRASAAGAAAVADGIGRGRAVAADGDLTKPQDACSLVERAIQAFGCLRMGTSFSGRPRLGPLRPPERPS